MDSNVSVATKPLPHHADTPVLEHREIHVPKSQNHGSSSVGASSSDESDIEENLVSQINYNTISSLAALKDMLHLNGEDTECGTFFQHYFLNHVNALPSRSLVSPYPFVEKRRLSECLEENEEEDENKKDKDKDKDKEEKDLDTKENGGSKSGSEKSLSETSSTSSKTTVQELTGTTHKFLVTKTKIPKDTKDIKDAIETTTTTKTPSTSNQIKIPPALRRRHYNVSNTVHFPATDPRKPSVHSIFNRTSPLPSPHFDKRFFDSSLIEIRSQASSTSTVDQDSAEDIWIKRPESDGKNVSYYYFFFLYGCQIMSNLNC